MFRTDSEPLEDKYVMPNDDEEKDRLDLVSRTYTCDT